MVSLSLRLSTGNDNKKLAYIYHTFPSQWENSFLCLGKRNTDTAPKLRNRLKSFGISYGAIATDNWNSFKQAFKDDVHFQGKWATKGIEGNNCRLRHLCRKFLGNLAVFQEVVLSFQSLYFCFIFYQS